MVSSIIGVKSPTFGNLDLATGAGVGTLVGEGERVGEVLGVGWVGAGEGKLTAASTRLAFGRVVELGDLTSVKL